MGLLQLRGPPSALLGCSEGAGQAWGTLGLKQKGRRRGVEMSGEVSLLTFIFKAHGGQASFLREGPISPRCVLMITVKATLVFNRDKGNNQLCQTYLQWSLQFIHSAFKPLLCRFQGLGLFQQTLQLIDELRSPEVNVGHPLPQVSFTVLLHLISQLILILHQSHGISVHPTSAVPGGFRASQLGRGRMVPVAGAVAGVQAGAQRRQDGGRPPAGVKLVVRVRRDRNHLVQQTGPPGAQVAVAGQVVGLVGVLGGAGGRQVWEQAALPRATVTGHLRGAQELHPAAGQAAQRSPSQPRTPPAAAGHLVTPQGGHRVPRAVPSSQRTESRLGPSTPGDPLDPLSLAHCFSAGKQHFALRSSPRRVGTWGLRHDVTLWLQRRGTCPRGDVGLSTLSLPWAKEIQVWVQSGSHVSVSGCREVQPCRQVWAKSQALGVVSYHCLVISADGSVRMHKKPHKYLELCSSTSHLCSSWKYKRWERPSSYDYFPPVLNVDWHLR